MIENSFAKKIYKNFIQIQLKERQSSNLIIGIDGPTASGKTILADNLKKAKHALSKIKIVNI